LSLQLVSEISDLCGPKSQTSQTDGQTTCDRNTALCTKVHRAVKITGCDLDVSDRRAKLNLPAN